MSLMGTGPIIHLIGSRDGAVGSMLETAAGGGARIRSWESPPSPTQVAPGDQVVVDMTAGDGHVRPEQVGALAEVADIWIVTGVTLVPANWLALARDPRVRLISPGGNPDGLSGLVQGLEEQIRVPPGGAVAQLVLQHTPLFNPVATLVTAVCEHPWRVRRPCDLAAVVGMSRHRLLQACRALGFERVEHFITAVRMVALSLLTAERGLSLPVARRTLGISDTSNARRQLERARHRSGAALSQLPVLVA